MNQNADFEAITGSALHSFNLNFNVILFYKKYKNIMLSGIIQLSILQNTDKFNAI